MEQLSYHTITKCYNIDSGALARERASEARWVKKMVTHQAEKIWSLRQRTGERAYVCSFVQTLGVEEGRLDVSLTGDLRNATVSRWDFSEKKTHLYLLCQQTFGDVDLTFKM